MAKFTTTFALLFACLLGTSMFFQMAEAGKKKRKIVKLLLLAASLIKKPKILPLPLPLPIPIPIKKTVLVPEAHYYPEPVYVPAPCGGGHCGGPIVVPAPLPIAPVCGGGGCAGAVGPYPVGPVGGGYPAY